MKPALIFGSGLTSTVALSILMAQSAQANSLVDNLVIPGDSTDLSGQANGANGNRLGVCRSLGRA